MPPWSPLNTFNPYIPQRQFFKVFFTNLHFIWLAPFNGFYYAECKPTINLVDILK